MNNRSSPRRSSVSRSRTSDRYHTGVFIIWAAAGFLLAAVALSKPLQSANDRSRWCTVWSLGEMGTYQIDGIDWVPEWSTIDKVRHRSSESEPYHFYSSKPPLLSTLVAGLYVLERKTLGYGLYSDPVIVSRILLVFVNVLPMVLALFAFRRSLRSLELSAFKINFMLLVLGFASMLNPFMTTLNNHTPAAVSLIFCLAAILRIRKSLEDASRVDFAIVGFTAALTCCFELPAALFGLATFAMVLTISRAKTLWYYVPAALIPLAAFFVTNIICTGGIKPFYAYYGTDKYEYVHNGIPSYWMNPQGLDANTENPVIYFLHCTVGHHGLFSLTPLFVLTLLGWKTGHRLPLKTLNRVGAALSVIVLLFYLSRTQNYNYGGNTSSLRWMLWLTPFWLYGMIPAVDRLLDDQRGRVLCSTLLAASVFTSVHSLQTPWKPSWLYNAMEGLGMIDYHVKPAPFSPPRSALLSALPTDSEASARWISADADGTQSLQLDVVGSVTVDEQPATALNLTVENTVAGSSSTVTMRLIVLQAAFEAGDDVTEWLRVVSSDADVTPGQKLTVAQTRVPDASVQTLIRGIPVHRAYVPAGTRWVPTAPGASTAWECQTAASRVEFEHPVHGRCWQRCDVWYCDQVPFGVLQWTISVARHGTGELLSTNTWLSESVQ